MSKHPWLTPEEVIEITGWPRATFYRKSPSLNSRESDAPAKNGKRPRVYDPASLPAEAQRKLFEKRLAAETRSAIQPSLLPIATEQQRALFSEAPEVSLQERAQLTPQDNEVAQKRYDVIAPLVNWQRGYKTNFTTLGGAEIRNSNQLVEYLSQQHNISARTIWNWHQRFATSGFTGLADRGRRDKGTSRFFLDYPKALEFITAKYLSPKERLSVRVVYDALCREWPSLYNHGSQPPSYTTVRATLNSLPNPLATFAREGEVAYDNRHQPFLLRDFKQPVNSMWISDHRLMDVFVQNDVFPYVKAGAWMRLWFTALIDSRSRLLVGWAWCVDPSSNSIASALRMALAKYGKPKLLYMDNGKDYRKIAKTASLDELTPQTAGLLQRLKIESQHAQPYRPRSKAIESFFAIMSKRYDPIWGAAYAGHDAKHRSEENSLALKDHQKFLSGKLAESPLPTASEFIRITETWIENEYHQRSHGGEGMKKRSPRQVFDEEFPLDKRDPITNMVELEPLFWDHQKRTVSHSSVQLFKQTYEPADAEGGARLRMHDGREVIVACDPNNLGFAIACDLDGNFLSTLKAQALLAHGPISHEAVKEHERRNRRVKREMKSFLNGLAARASQQGYVTELGNLRRIAGAPSAAEVPANRMLPSPPARRGAVAVAATAPAYVGDVADEIANEILGGEK